MKKLTTPTEREQNQHKKDKPKRMPPVTKQLW